MGLSCNPRSYGSEDQEEKEDRIFVFVFVFVLFVFVYIVYILFIFVFVLIVAFRRRPDRACIHMTKGGEFWCVRKYNHFLENRGEKDGLGGGGSNLLEVQS